MRPRVAAAAWLAAAFTFASFAAGFWLSGITSLTRAILCGVAVVLTGLTMWAAAREYYIDVGRGFARMPDLGDDGASTPARETSPEDPKPNIAPTLAHLTRIHLNHSTHLFGYGDGTRFDTPYTAAVVPFRNEPDASRRTSDAFDIRARIAIGSELYPVTGYWLNSDSDQIHLPLGSSAQELVVAIRSRDGAISIVDDHRSNENYRLPTVLTIWEPGQAENNFPVGIQLIADGVLLGKFRYKLSTKLFDIR